MAKLNASQTWLVAIIATLMAYFIVYWTWIRDVYDVVAAGQFNDLQVVVTLQDAQIGKEGKIWTSRLEDFTDCQSIEIVNILREQRFLSKEIFDLTPEEFLAKKYNDNAKAKAEALSKIVGCIPAAELDSNLPRDFGIRVKRWYEP